MFQKSSVFELLVLSFHLIRQDDQADVAGFSFSSFSDGRVKHLFSFSIVEFSCLNFYSFKFDFQTFRCLLECIEECSGVLSRKVYDSASNTMLAVEDWLAVKLEEGLLSFFNVVVVSQSDPRHGDDPTLDSLKMFADFDSQFLQGSEFVVVSEFLHKVHDFPLFLIWRLDCVLRYLLSSELIKIFRNSSHETELWDEKDLEIFVLASSLNFQKWLFQVGDFELVLLLVVLSDGNASIVKANRIDIFED